MRDRKKGKGRLIRGNSKVRSESSKSELNRVISSL